MVLFHGTSKENLDKILQDGFTNNKQLIWNCSDKDMTYFWSLNRLIECKEIDSNGGLDYQKHDAIQRAFESAQITASLHSQSNTIHVIEIELPNDYEIEEDSCFNMSGSVQIENEEINKFGMIKAIHTANFTPKLALYHIADLVVNNKYFEHNLDHYQVALCEAISKSNIFLDDLLYFEYNTEEK